jgi:UTP--glucose-1-phosphate uridylyltransferase
MVRLMQVQDFHALAYDGTTYDCGDKIGLLRANIAFALAHPELGGEARAAMQTLLDRPSR